MDNEAVQMLLDKYAELAIVYADRTTREINAGRCSKMRVLLSGMLQEYQGLIQGDQEKKGGEQEGGQ